MLWNGPIKNLSNAYLESKGWRVRKAINGHDLVEMDVLGRS
jgi:hypothetical protein